MKNRIPIHRSGEAVSLQYLSEPCSAQTGPCSCSAPTALVQVLSNLQKGLRRPHVFCQRVNHWCRTAYGVTATSVLE